MENTSFPCSRARGSAPAMIAFPALHIMKIVATIDRGNMAAFEALIHMAWTRALAIAYWLRKRGHAVVRATSFCAAAAAVGSAQSVDRCAAHVFFFLCFRPTDSSEQIPTVVNSSSTRAVIFDIFFFFFFLEECPWTTTNSADGIPYKLLLCATLNNN